MKKISQTFAGFLSVACVLIFGLFVSQQSVKAETVDDVITSINVYNQKGEKLTESLSPWERFQIDANFAFNYGKVKPGDTTTIALPAQFALEGADFEVKDDDDNLVATAVVDAPNKQMTLTYTDYVLTRSHIEGKVHLLARIDHTVFSSQGSVPLRLTVGKNIIEYGNIDFKGIPGQATPFTFVKYGWDNVDDVKSITYSLNLNQLGQNLDNVVISDQLGFDSGEIDPASFQILKGSWVTDSSDNSYHLSQDRENVTSNYQINLTADKRSFTINMGNIQSSEGFYIRYRVKFPTAPVSGTQFPNEAILKANNIEDQRSSASVRYQRANGYARGDVYGVQVIKKDDKGKLLEGAEFTLYDEDGVTAIETVTSDANGVAAFSNLVKERYVIKETKAPSGYQLSNEVINVNAAELDTYGSGILHKDFVNIAVPRAVQPPTKSSSSSDSKTGTSSSSSTSSQTGTEVTVDTTAEGTGNVKVSAGGKKVLPKTGENASWIMIAAGVALVGLVGFIVLRSKKSHK
ncbi:SpaA isopeptide-forming pilin-related protein [Streptococcus sp. DD11]|uniref:Ig-like domain-containing protein n=1 Tax=Streptococcus sp. DD11 TaxID=1777879 RepID=UPI000B0E53C1|nr:SpaA isopeptide-forming pilin-related protein [Streptococcus sp. DD11]